MCILRKPTNFKQFYSTVNSWSGMPRNNAGPYVKWTLKRINSMKIKKR